VPLIWCISLLSRITQNGDVTNDDDVDLQLCALN